MFLPLKVGSRIVCGSWKSGSQPTFGQMLGSLFGTLQNFVYIVACVTEIVFTLNPILAMSAATTWAVFDPGERVVGDRGHLRAACTCRPCSRPSSASAFAFATSPEMPWLGNGLNSKPPACVEALAPEARVDEVRGDAAVDRAAAREPHRVPVEHVARPPGGHRALSNGALRVFSAM